MASNTASIKIVEYAGLNTIPIKTPIITNYVVGLVLGFGIPIGIIVFIHIFNVKIVDIREAEKKLKVPNLGHINRSKVASKLVVFNEPRVAVTEAFRSLRTNIYYISPKEKQATIAINLTIYVDGTSLSVYILAV